MEPDVKDLQQEVLELKSKCYDYMEQAGLFKVNYEGLITKVCEIFGIEVKEVTDIDIFINKLEELARKVAPEDAEESTEKTVVLSED